MSLMTRHDLENGDISSNHSPLIRAAQLNKNPEATDVMMTIESFPYGAHVALGLTVALIGCLGIVANVLILVTSYRRVKQYLSSFVRSYLFALISSLFSKFALMNIL